MYALVDIQGKQYKVENGSVLKVDRLEKEKGDNVEFDSVLMISDEGKVKIGQPFVKGTKVKARIEEHILDKKVTIYKHKKRKGYRRKQGHRQSYTLVKVEDIKTG
jgi:large subunit ribosomal protein L21